MTIPAAAKRVADLLKRHDLKVVFAESCTGGLVSGALTRFPGISDHHCGGMVVYRNATKSAYLGIDSGLLDDPGPVSADVAEQLAWQVLLRTSEANVSAAVTGHLGPDAPRQLDGVVFFCVARRDASGEIFTKTRRLRYPRGTTRLWRQRQAVEGLLKLLAMCLRKPDARSAMA